MSPRVTVLMPVYNASTHLLEAVNSVLSSGFRNFELLAIDDGSTDDSADLLRSISDPRIRIVQNPKNMGVAATLNRGLTLARGDFIARMDSDDICMPDRLARQVAFMEANPKIGVSGTWARTFGAAPVKCIRPPLSPNEIHVQLLAFNAMCHPTVIFRGDIFAEHHLRYATDAHHCEDLDLWMRASEYFQLANLPLTGLRYRVHASQVTNSFAPEQKRTLARLQRRQLLSLVAKATEAEIQLHLNALDLSRQVTYDELVAVGEWLEHLEDCNARLNRYDIQTFQAFLAQRWLNVAHRGSPPSMEIWRIWRRSRLANVKMAARLWLLCKKGLLR